MAQRNKWIYETLREALQQEEADAVPTSMPANDDDTGPPITAAPHETSVNSSPARVVLDSDATPFEQAYSSLFAADGSGQDAVNSRLDYANPFETAHVIPFTVGMLSVPLRNRMFCELYAGAGISVGHEACCMLSHKLKGGVPEDQMNILLSGCAHRHFRAHGENHLYPTSMYQIEQILELLVVDDFKGRIGDHEYINFGIGRSIQNLFRDKLFCDSLFSSRERPAPDVWTAENYKRLDIKLKGELFNPDNGAYELTVDWVQPFETVKTYSIGTIWMRSHNVRPSLRSCSRLFTPIMIIPGPSEPTAQYKPNYQGGQYCFSDFNNVLVREFAQLSATGVMITDYYGRTFLHKPFLTAYSGDTPVLAKLKAWCGHTGALGCCYCSFNGGWYHGAVRWLGYAYPYEQFILYDDRRTMFAWEAPKWKLENMQQVVEFGDPAIRPVHFINELALLETFDIQESILFPYFHKWFEGVGKDMLSAWKIRMSSANVKEFGRRCDLIIASIPRGRHGTRKFENPLQYAQSMSQLKVVFCTYLPFLFHGLVPHPIWEQVLRYHKISVYVCTRQLTVDPAKHAAVLQELKEFARQCEKIHDVTVMTGNLHGSVCHMLDQVFRYGPLYLLNDLWGERCQHVGKFLVKYRSNTKNIHVVMAKIFLAQTRLLEIENSLLKKSAKENLDVKRFSGIGTWEALPPSVQTCLSAEFPIMNQTQFYSKYFDGFDTYSLPSRAKVAIGRIGGPYVYGKLQSFFVVYEDGRDDAFSAYACVQLYDCFEKHGFPHVMENYEPTYKTFNVDQIACPVEIMWDAEISGEGFVMFEYFHPDC